MTPTTYEGFNDNNLKAKLINYLINYLNSGIRNRSRNPVTFYLDRTVYDEFVDVCRRLGLLKGKSKGNIAVEALMNLIVENFKEHPKLIQTTLFYKPVLKVNQKVELNVAQKLELKIVREDLTRIIDSLENRRGNQEFYTQRLREILPKAIKIFEKTENPELRQLLEKAEKWV
jgi:hypothetical protein